MEGEIESVFVLFEVLLVLEDGDFCLVMYSKFMAVLCKVGDVKKVRWLFDDRVRKGSIFDVIMYIIMINGYCKANFLLEVFILFYDMKSRGIIFDVVIYIVLFDGYFKLSLKKFNNFYLDDYFIKKFVTVELVVRREMLEMEVKFDVVCYIVLIDKYCKLDDL